MGGSFLHEHTGYLHPSTPGHDVYLQPPHHSRAYLQVLLRISWVVGPVESDGQRPWCEGHSAGAEHGSHSFCGTGPWEEELGHNCVEEGQVGLDLKMGHVYLVSYHQVEDNSISIC